METFLIRALQLILSLSILVVLHEFGHFGFARLFKIRVDKFYVFFNPKFSLIRAKKINGKWKISFFAKNIPNNERAKLDEDGKVMLDEKGKPIMETIPLKSMSDDDWRKYPEKTEWGIGWLPLGGYCKISGMIDESMDKTQMQEKPKIWEFRSRPVYQRFLVMFGGVLVNFILALIIYSAILFTWGKEYIPLDNAKYGLSFSQPMIDAGFKDGDKIVAIDGEKYNQLATATEAILVEKANQVEVMRGEELITIDVPTNLTEKILASRKVAMSYRYPFVLEQSIKGLPAYEAGLRAGDSIVAINGVAMNMYQDIILELSLKKGENVDVTYIRNNVQEKTSLAVTEEGKIGVQLKSPLQYIKTEKETFGFLKSIPAGIQLGWDTLVGYVKQFKLVFTKQGAQSLGGFGTIGKLFPPTWDWHIFWTMTAFLSIILAFMNLLPIPGLDGGYILFLIYEAITGKKPSDKFMEYAVTAGMLFLLILLVYANGNDIFRALF